MVKIGLGCGSIESSVSWEVAMAIPSRLGPPAAVVSAARTIVAVAVAAVVASAAFHRWYGWAVS